MRAASKQKPLYCTETLGSDGLGKQRRDRKNTRTTVRVSRSLFIKGLFAASSASTATPGRGWIVNDGTGCLDDTTTPARARRCTLEKGQTRQSENRCREKLLLHFSSSERRGMNRSIDLSISSRCCISVARSENALRHNIPMGRNEVLPQLRMGVERSSQCPHTFRRDGALGLRPQDIAYVIQGSDGDAPQLEFL